MHTRLCLRGVSLYSFTTVIDISFGKANASISLAFLISNEIVKVILKAMGRKENMHRKNSLSA